MKNLLLLLLCSITHPILAQHIGGLYSGKLVNDSTHKEQQYELALSEYRGEISGYAYTTFVVRDTFYYSIKKVSARRVGKRLEVTDMRMLRHNFPQAPDKGVRQVMQVDLPFTDTVEQMNGSWHTTATKQFYSIGGNVQLQRTRDSSGSALYAHLQEGQQPEAKPVATSGNTTASPLPARLVYTERKQHILQTIHTGSDSLVLSFFDNGIVDGDTISVYLNNAPVIVRNKLTAAASKKVIYLSPQTPVAELMLVAENLGTIPPNTGLLVVQDGEQRHAIHFTADLQTNAVIRFTRSSRL